MHKLQHILTKGVVASASGGFVFGGSTQIINKFGSKVGGIAGGGQSGSFSSITRSWAFNRGMGASGRCDCLIQDSLVDPFSLFYSSAREAGEQAALQLEQEWKADNL